MKPFSEQLAETRANLERLERLHAEHPDLLEHGSLIEVTPRGNRVFIHAACDQDRDWLAFARKFAANWRREPSPSDWKCYDWSGEYGGVEISILQAERREEPRPLFAAEPEMAI